MTEEMLKDAAPTLTFEPFAEEKAETLAVQEPAPAVEAPVFDESSLSDAERKMVNDFAEKIQISRRLFRPDRPCKHQSGAAVWIWCPEKDRRLL